MLALLLVLAAPAASSELVKLETIPGPPTAVRVQPQRAGVFVAGCLGVVWEAFDAESGAYTPLVSPPCEEPHAAIELDQEGLEVPMVASSEGGTIVRAVVVLGQGCQAGLPLELASCERLEVAESSLVTVKSPAGPQ